ncbi:hypothetical protein EVAR_27681_1 [Eumeta japonica]|uniref:Uncharacterized protein n=1 Tax=Eumeta variegata TaxID=151549 RepID=A0A4C2A470_EUMVA|nr:hypothetical protein EVAR_27681_1 [Eumeta japonica]
MRISDTETGSAPPARCRLAAAGPTRVTNRCVEWASHAPLCPPCLQRQHKDQQHRPHRPRVTRSRVTDTVSASEMLQIGFSARRGRIYHMAFGLQPRTTWFDGPRLSQCDRLCVRGMRRGWLPLDETHAAKAAARAL